MSEYHRWMSAAELTSEASEACAVDSLYVLSAGLPEAGPDSSDTMLATAVSGSVSGAMDISHKTRDHGTRTYTSAYRLMTKSPET